MKKITVRDGKIKILDTDEDVGPRRPKKIRKEVIIIAQIIIIILILFFL